MRNIDINDNDTLVAATGFLRQSEDRFPVSLSLNVVKGTGDGFRPADVEEFIKAIGSTTACIEEANITLTKIHEDSSATHETMMRLCAALGTIPSLWALNWHASCLPGDVPHSIRYIAQTLQKARSLASLTCWDIGLSGEPTDFQDLARVVQHHPTLKEVSFTECTLDSGKGMEMNVNPVLAAFATIPNLTDLAVGCFFPTEKTENVPATSSVLHDLCGHSSLRTLDLVGAGGGGITAVSQAIKSGPSSISTLWVDTSLQVGELKELGAIIRTSDALRHLNIYLHPFEDDQAMHHLIEALNENPKLTKVDFIFDERESFFSSEIQTALISMLAEHNYTLQSLSFDLSSSLEVRNYHTETMVEYYLTLNRLGRNGLLSNPNATKDEWITSLVSSRGDLDAVYYFLSKNPSLCASLHRD